MTLTTPIRPRQYRADSTNGRPASSVPPLQNGDRLSGEEFDRRYKASPPGLSAELIEGVVYVASPLFEPGHGTPHFNLSTWLGVYQVATPGVIGSDNTSVRLDDRNRPQPDLYLRIPDSHGGRTRVAADGYLEGAPDLIAEVAASSAAYDLHAKLEAYRRNGVREYLVWRTYDVAFDWFALRGGRFARLRPGRDGVCRSRVFPGLWLDPAALLRRDMVTVMRVLQEGLAAKEQRAFVEKLRKAAERLSRRRG
jgi:Uma2 family endonuclease